MQGKPPRRVKRDERKESSTKDPVTVDREEVLKLFRDINSLVGLFETKVEALMSLMKAAPSS